MDSGKSPPRINIVIANLPVFLAEALERVIWQQSDMRLLKSVDTYTELSAAMSESVDVVLLGAERLYPLPSIGSYLLETYPQLRIITVSFSGDQGIVYWLELRHEWISTVSTGSLIKQIRQFDYRDSV